MLLGVVGDGFWLDLGTPDRYLSGTRAVLDGRCDWPLPNDYEQVDGTVLVHRTAEVRGRAGPYVVVGRDVVVADDASVRDSVVFEGASIGAGAVIEWSVVAEHTIVAPGTRLSETVTAPGSVAG
jgi:mannose-1-phosphate guanylyltransferase